MTAKAKTTKSEEIQAPSPAPTEVAASIIAIKALDKDFRCRNHQFEVGKTYTASGKIIACENGFHACENPFDVLSYYNLVDCRFAVVELSGETARHDGYTKIAAASITITAELKLPDFIKRAVNWIISATKDKGDDPSGYNARIGSSGYNAQIGSSGDNAQIGSSGYNAQIGSSGYNARIGSSGYNAQIGSSGYNAQIGSSGDNAQIGSSGYNAQIGSSGDSAQIGSSGYNARIDSTGENAVVASAGRLARVRGKIGAWMSLASFDDQGKCNGFATGCIEGNELKPDTWYVARDGRFVEET